MKKKYIYLIIFASIVIITISVFSIKERISNDKPNDVTISDETNNDKPNDVIISDETNNDEIEDKNTFVIKSTKDSPIVKDGLEATKIKVRKVFNDYEITATIKNNTKEKVNGFYIEIFLLDSKGDTVTYISENSDSIIEPNKNYILNSSITGLDKEIEISGARIGTLEKNK